jgi:peptidoglycan/LPS O-acetylase OafA/YrhL
MRHRANLDLLRARAVSTVLLDHLVPTLSRYTGYADPAVLRFTVHIGYTGVMAFFVHTSLVLMDSLARLHRQSTRVAWRFYVRRCFRLYPLVAFSILLILLLHIPGNTWSDPEPVTLKEVVSNLLLVQNLWVKKDVLGPLWSLPYEAQMYLVFPALFLLTRRRWATAWIAALFAAAVALGVALWVYTGRENAAEFVPCFLSGILCYTLRHRIRPVLPAVLWPAFVVGWIVAFCSITTQYWTAWVFCLGLGLAINLFHESRLPVLNFAAERIALYSYGMYLLHVPVLYLIFEWLGVENPWVAAALEFLLSLTAAAITFHLIERPCIELGRRLTGGEPAAPIDTLIASAAP